VDFWSILGAPQPNSHLTTLPKVKKLVGSLPFLGFLKALENVLLNAPLGD